MNKKELRKLQSPDLFQTRVSAAFEWCKKNLIIVSSLAAIVVLGAFVFAGIHYINVKKEEARVSQINEIDKIYTNEQNFLRKKRTLIQEDIKKLRAKHQKERKLSDPKLTQQKVEPPEIKEKQKLLKELKEDHSNSTQKYLDFYRDNKDSSEGRRSGLNVVRSYLKEKKTTEAESLIAQLLTKSFDNKLFSYQIRSVYLNLLIDNSKFKEAEAHVEMLILETKPEDLPKTLLLKANILYLANKKDKSLIVIDKIINDYPTSREIKNAQTLKYLIIS